MCVELTFAFLENVDSSNMDMDTVVAGLLVRWVLGEQELKRETGTETRNNWNNEQELKQETGYETRNRKQGIGNEQGTGTGIRDRNWNK